MLNERMEKGFNEQINFEVFSAYLYWSMAAWFGSRNLAGCANHFRVKALEEMTHADRFFNFINDRGGRVRLAAVDGPRIDWDTPEQVFVDAYEHETQVTARINELMNIAEELRDNASRVFVQWFVTEQVEEEAQADDLVQQFKLMAGAPGGLFMLDRELAQMVFTPPAKGA